MIAERLRTHSERVLALARSTEASIEELTTAGVELPSGVRHISSARTTAVPDRDLLEGLTPREQEVASQPGFGHFARFANMAFVDRSNGSQAKAALAPVVERLREGYSIAIAPEGTRSPTRTVGPFKKGAFHLAMQGGVRPAGTDSLPSGREDAWFHHRCSYAQNPPCPTFPSVVLVWPGSPRRKG